MFIMIDGNCVDPSKTVKMSSILLRFCPAKFLKIPSTCPSLETVPQLPPYLFHGVGRCLIRSIVVHLFLKTTRYKIYMFKVTRGGARVHQAVQM